MFLRSLKQDKGLVSLANALHGRCTYKIYTDKQTIELFPYGVSGLLNGETLLFKIGPDIELGINIKKIKDDFKIYTDSIYSKKTRS